MQGSLSSKEILNIPEKPESPSDYESMADQENWLSAQWDRTPFLLYKCWLLFNFPINLCIQMMTIYAYIVIKGVFNSSAAALGIGFVLFFYGSFQMLYAMNRKKSRIAQEGFLNFQYFFIISIISVFSTLNLKGPLPEEFRSIAFPLVLLYLLISPIIHLVGGYAVLKVFESNNPLTRAGSHFASEDDHKDFLEQNEVIASELSKYDNQLNSCYFITYNWLLKLSVICELIFLFRFSFYYFFISAKYFGGPQKVGLEMFLLLILFGISNVLNASSCFDMEVAMRTRDLAGSRGAIFWLIICTILTFIKAVLSVKWIELNLDLEVSDGGFLWWFLCSILVPFLGFIGAYQVKKILEERERLVNASSYSQDLYL